MQPLSRDSLAANAFRTLGLSASASQAAIDAAARRMRIWPDERLIPPTRWDLPWLGPVSRTRSNIERAYATLNEPRSRAEQRLLWYHAHGPVAANADDDQQVPSPGEAADARRLPTFHNEMLRSLHTAYQADAEVTDVARWRRVVERVNRLASRPDYAAWLERLEVEGDFEKRASPAELRAAVQVLPAAIVAALVPKAQAALDRDDANACADIAQILRAAGAGCGASSSPLGLLLDRLEDALERQCSEMERDLRDKLRTHRTQADVWHLGNRQACHTAATFYNETISVGLDRFCALAEHERDRLERCRSRCAQVLALLAMGWEWAGRFRKAEATQRVALSLAQGSAGEFGIRKDLSRYEELAAQEEAGEASWRNSPLVPELKPPATRRPAPKQRDNPMAGVGGVAAVAIGIMVMRFLVMLGNGSGSNGTGKTNLPHYFPPSERQSERREQEMLQNVYRQVERDIRAKAGEARDGMKSVFTPSTPDTASPAPDPRFNLDPSPSGTSGTIRPVPPRPHVDPARVNDPFGESNREQ
ncbi:MAG: hypothetical protein JWN40_3838 [Phycisphaerales bacterium]|nr:hypothetical protein [Phycisphaerales bacterium]